MSNMPSGPMKQIGGAGRRYVEIGGKAKISIDFCLSGFRDHQMKMLEYGRPVFFLDMERMEMDGGVRVFYDCDGFARLDGLFGRGPFNIFRVLHGIGDALLRSEDYLIHSSCITLEPEWIFVDPKTLAVRLMFLPDGSGSQDICGDMEALVRSVACQDGFGYFFICADMLAQDLRERSRGLRCFCNALIDAERHFVRREQILSASLPVEGPNADAAGKSKRNGDLLRDAAAPFIRFASGKNHAFILCQSATAAAVLRILTDSGFAPADKAVYVALSALADFLLVRSFDLYKPFKNQ